MEGRTRRANGEGSIYKRKDGRWCAVITLETGRRRSFYGPTRQAVAARAQQARQDEKLGRLVDAQDWTVKSYLMHWVDSIKKPRVRETTWRTYRIALGHVVLPLGGMKLTKLRAAHIEALYADLAGQGMRGRTIRHIHIALKSAMRHAVKSHYLPADPLETVDSPQIVEREFAAFSQEEQDTLLSAESRYWMLWYFLFHTGVRVGEAVALTWDDIDEAARIVHIRRTAATVKGGEIKTFPPKTDKGVRDIPLSARTLELLKEHRQRMRNERIKSLSWQEQGLVFPNTSGGYMRSGAIGSALRRQLQVLGLPHRRVHDIRHTFATRMLEKGVNPRVVQQLMGHANISITLGLYSHVSPQMGRDAIELLG